MKNLRRAARQHGFTMIEVLVTLVILLLGLLGLAGLQTRAQVAETESYQRTQALVLARDMVDRINANRGNAAGYLVATTAPLGTGSTTYSSTDCSTLGTIAEMDLCYWDYALKGAAETSGTSKIGAMIGARGCVVDISSVTDTNVYLVEIVWQGLQETAAPPSSVACGSGSYDINDRTRRAVTAIVKLGTLSP